MTLAGQKKEKLIPQQTVEYSPIIKCPGGKGRLLNEIFSNFPKSSFSTYVEPFFGGGAVGLNVATRSPEKNLIFNDLNPDVVNVYTSVRDNLDSLLQRLNYYHLFNNKSDYLNVRKEFNSRKGLKNVEQAARFIFLNKVGYNGLIRYNLKGEFNVPFGRYTNPRIFDRGNLENLHRLLKKKSKVQMYNKDFSSLIWNALHTEKPEKLFFYVDPPYDILNETSKFAEYTSQGFSQADHHRLKRDLDAVSRAGARFLLSSSDTRFIRDLFHEYTIIEIKAGRSINCKKGKRGKISELLICNY